MNGVKGDMFHFKDIIWWVYVIYDNLVCHNNIEFFTPNENDNLSWLTLSSQENMKFHFYIFFYRIQNISFLVNH
jgi:hypothetical protein